MFWSLTSEPLHSWISSGLQVRNSLGLSEDGEDEEGGATNGSLAKLWGQKLKIREKSYSRAELASLWSLLQQEEYTFLR